MWQAGDVMKNRSQTILEYREESSAASRLDAWDAAFKMITNHPITGVGLASFVRAFPDHSDKQPREAHNTFLQITAEAGILAGLMYCFIIFSSMIEIWKRSKKLKAFDDKYRNRFLFLLNDAIFASILGYSVCSLFLSLHVYEIFYFLCLLANSLAFLSNKITQEQKNNTREHA